MVGQTPCRMAWLIGFSGLGSLEPLLERLVGAYVAGVSGVECQVKLALVAAALCGGFLIGTMPISASLVFGACIVGAWYWSRKV